MHKGYNLHQKKMKQMILEMFSTHEFYRTHKGRVRMTFPASVHVSMSKHPMEHAWHPRMQDNHQFPCTCCGNRRFLGGSQKEFPSCSEVQMESDVPNWDCPFLKHTPAEKSGKQNQPVFTREEVLCSRHWKAPKSMCFCSPQSTQRLLQCLLLCCSQEFLMLLIFPKDSTP